MKLEAKQRLRASEIEPHAKNLISHAVHALKAVVFVDGRKATNIKKVATALTKAGLKAKVISDLYRNSSPAYTKLNDDTLYLNDACDFWGVPAYVTKKKYVAGLLSSDDPMHFIYHEYAHIAKSLSDVRWQGNEEAVAAKVSKYATQNRNEFIAEYTAGVMAGKSYSQDVDDLYTKLMEL